MRRIFTDLTLADAMGMVPTNSFVRWSPDVAERNPSDILQANFVRLRSFDMYASEAAKVMVIDTVLAEVAPSYPNLKIWKAVPLESEVLAGIADYVISPDYAFVKAPLLCIVEAKKDDFAKGIIQCIGEMVTCRTNNRAAELERDVYGIVSNGQIWQFYRLANNSVVYQSDEYGLLNLPNLLGILDHVFAACAANIPQAELSRTAN